MSRSAKAFLAFSSLVGVGTIFGVHFLQIQERETMFQGVLRDDARLAAKKVQKAREAEFEDQNRKRAYLEGVQSVTNPSIAPPSLKGEVPTSSDGMDFNCKTCEK